jgi:hypothetical protein
VRVETSNDECLSPPLTNCEFEVRFFDIRI